MNIILIVIIITTFALFMVGSLYAGAALIFPLMLLKAKGGAAVPAYVPPKPTVTGWGFYYSPNMPQQMWDAGDGTFYFDFPTKDGVHYVYRAGSAALGQTITMTFSLAGDGTLVPTQGTTPYVTLYLQRAGDNMSGAGAYEFYRFWSGATKLTGAGDYTVSVPLTYNIWTGVMGRSDQNGFAACLANLQNIGFTFGDPGAGASGHGVYVTNGTMRFTLKNFTIN